MKVQIDGYEFEVPEGNVTGKALRRHAGLPAEATLYRVAEGKHEVIEDDDLIELEPEREERFGTVTRFRTGSDGVAK